MSEKILLFNRWDIGEVKVNDLGLQGYINLKPIIVPRTGGRNTQIMLKKAKMNIVERFINKLMVPGHKGKKHRITSGRCTGNTAGIYLAVIKAFEVIQQRTKQNPVQILVKAIENAAMLEEITSYRLGGIIARRSVLTSPQRRLDLALRHLAQGIYKITFKGKISLENAIADELLATSSNDKKSFAIQERQRAEREAEGAR